VARSATRRAPARAHTKATGDETRARLLSAGERLFARKGLDAVSVRDITAAARANTAAIHYHFGSKQGLVEAILERRARELGERRAELLDEIERKPDATLRDVIAAFVLPTAEIAADRRHGGYYYVGFLSAVLGHPEHLSLVIDTYEHHTSRYRAALAKVTPHLSRETRELRWALAKDMVNRTLGNPAAPVHQWLERQAPTAERRFTDHLIDFLVGAFEAPSTMAQSNRQRRRASP
jgi:AcrR family transcriptional regulator